MPNKKILIVKNASIEDAGLIEVALKENGLNYHIVDLSKGQDFPNPNNYSAVFVLGGHDSANDQTPKMKNELKRIKETVDAQIPYFGVCLGMQTLVKANGGEVYKNRIKEIGLRDPEGKYFEIELTNEGKKDTIFQGLKSPLKIFQLHGETVSLKSGMTLLAIGKYCKNQAVKIGKNAYGLQGHMELTEAMFEEWIREDNDLRNIDEISLRDDYTKLKSEYESNGRMIINNFLDIANLE